MKSFTLEIVTPSRTAFNGQVTSVTLPGSLGTFQVLVNHAPILSTLEVGSILVVEESGKTLKFATGGGTVEMLQNKMLLLADSLELPEEIDRSRAEKSADRARKRLAEKKAEVDVTRAEASLNRALNRIKVSSLR